MSTDDRLRRPRRTTAPPDPGSAARRRALGLRPRRAPRPEPAGRLEAPARAPRGGPRRGPPAGPRAVVRPAGPAARRGRRMARALPRVLDGAPGRARTTPGGEPVTDTDQLT